MCDIYTPISRIFLQIISKDSNIQVVASAAKCVEGLANGLRKNFKGYVSMVS